MIEWTESLEIGDGRIDAQHKELLDLVNAFQAKRLAGHDTSVLRRALDEIVLFTRYHFYCEESLMDEVGFPGLATHRDLHAVLRGILTRLGKDLDSGRYSAAEIEDFLVPWVMDHMVDEDRKIRDFLNRNGALPSIP